MAGLGQLHVRVENNSYFLSQNLPYVIRDASMAFVAQGTVGEKGMEDLPEGYYSVEVITPSGAPHTELVHVQADTTVEVVIDGEDDPDDTVHEERRGPAAPPTREEQFRPRLVETTFCTARENKSGWTFSPYENLAGVPTAQFSSDGDHDWVVSLPLNPQGREQELREARVSFERISGRPTRPVVRFSKHRRVSRMVDGVLRHNTVAAAGLLDEAAGLLLYKYDDPPAAALGGLTLFRYGRLRERQDWIENLARDFAWLPDGQILCAALLMDDDDQKERDRGLKLLLSATPQRPLYSDGLSLASDLLRRWPDTRSNEARAQRLSFLSAFSCVTRWDEVMLTTRTGW
jgi:hypothetical protein